MGWAVGYDEHWKRDIGYGVPAWCDHPDCDGEIDRGLSYVCGGEPYGGDKGCGLYFCGDHQQWNESASAFTCDRCLSGVFKPYNPKPDRPEWLHHKATDPSWAKWRTEQTEQVKQ